MTCPHTEEIGIRLEVRRVPSVGHKMSNTLVLKGLQVMLNFDRNDAQEAIVVVTVCHCFIVHSILVASMPDLHDLT